MTVRLALLVSLMLAVLAACGRNADRPPRPADVGDRPPTALPAESLAPAATLIKLLRAQLTTADPVGAQVAILCEVFRLTSTVGVKRSNALLDAASELVYAHVDDSVRDRLDRALGNHVFRADQGCDSLAKAGVLGDTIYPKRKYSQ
jgi:hypothetical protein